MKTAQQGFFLGLTASLLLVCQAYAVPVVTLDASNVGIGSISVTVSGTDILIEEDWTQLGNGFLRIEGLDAGVNYTVTKRITNHTGADWTRFANELLDPSGQANDALDPQPYPGFVPTGFTTSNDFDGLSFAQGSGIPRTSVAFTGVLVDELSNARDFIDFFTGTVLGSGGTDTISFGLRDNDADNQPFLLSQRPNASSVGEVPEPSTLFLLGTGFAGLAWMARRKMTRNTASNPTV